MNPKFWQNKRVLITGHTGFKGSWLSQWLIQAGAKVYGSGLLPPTDPSLFSLLNLESQMDSRLVDIRDKESVDSNIKTIHPEIIFHMAAQPLVRYSYQHPIDTFEINVMGTANVLESSRNLESLKAIVVITTDKCYDNNDSKNPFKETDPLGGKDPYSSSKAATELVASSYYLSFLRDKNIALATVRAGNVIGGCDFAEDRLIPDIVRSWSKEKKVIIRNPNAIRPWQHVLDPLNGYLMIAEKLCNEKHQFAGPWNFGPDLQDCLPVEKVISLLAAQWGKNIGWDKDANSQPHEAHFLSLDCSKAKSKLEWKSKLNLTTAIEWTVELYQAHFQNKSIKECCLNQIRLFEKMSNE